MPARGGAKDRPSPRGKRRDYPLTPEVSGREFLPVEQVVIIRVVAMRIGARRLFGQVAEAVRVRIRILLAGDERVETVRNSPELSSMKAGFNSGSIVALEPR